MATTELASKKSENNCENISFYSSVKPLAVLSKFLGAFPLNNTLNYDGLKLGFSWLCLGHLWDVLICTCVIVGFMIACLRLLTDPHYIDASSHGDDTSLWLLFTCYFVAVRGVIQFITLHFYAQHFPKLFHMIEKYHQETGVAIIKKCAFHWFTKYLSLLWTFGIILLLELTSIYFFTQLCEAPLFLFVFLLAGLYVFANIWEQLPMNMFVLIVKYLIHRFDEISAEVRKLRENITKESGDDLERLRMQYGALIRIVSQTQKCYGIQLALNLFFLLLDTVLQLFFFFCFTSSRNIILLVLVLYYICITFVLLAVVNQLEQTNNELLEELSSFELNSLSKDQQLQIQCFTLQIVAHPLKISACGFVVINNALICSLLAAIATYIVMLVQFMPYIESQFFNITGPSA